MMELLEKLKNNGLTALINKNKKEIVISPKDGYYKTLQKIRKICDGMNLEIKVYHQCIMINY